MEQIKEEVKPIVTCLYGSNQEESKLYDMNDILKDKMINYKISKIKCQLKSNKGIYGIQLIYRNLIDGKETTIIDIQSKEKDLIEQEFDLCGEYILDIKTWITLDTIILIGFEITTNRKRTFKFGYGNDEQLVRITDLSKLDKVVIGFGVYANSYGLVTGIYGYYINKNSYIYYLYEGILSLRKKLKNKEFDEKIQKKLNNMSKKNQILYRICKLSENQFYNIMKYTQ